MPGTSHRARYALGSTIVALSLALLAGALPFFGGASADNTRELIRVSFRPENAPSVDGWRSDHGEPYDARRAYGWVRDNVTGEAVDMTANATARSYAADRTDTFVAMQPDGQRWGRWVMDVPNGTYRVAVTVGDAAAAGGTQNLAVEDQRVIEGFTPSADEPTRTATVDVAVTDGRLTLDPLYPNRAALTKLVSVVVSEVLGDDPPPTTGPPTTQPPTTEPPTTEPPTTLPPTTEPPTTLPPTTLPPTTLPPSGLRNQVGFAGGGKFLSYSDAEMKREMDGMVAAGGTWLRIGFLWSSLEQSPGVYYWAKLDQVVGWARERGLKVLANVSYTPTWARPSDCRDLMCPPANMDLYARFMGNLVRHYSQLGVKHYEVWNEPNQYFWWKPKPQPARYAEMVRKSYLQAKLADPSVTIVAGAMALARDNESGTTMNPRTFLTGMYRAGLVGQFDALSFHPYTGDADPRIVAFYSPITGVGPDLANIMASNGDIGKKVWGTEFAYSTATRRPGVSEAEASRLLRLYIDLWQQQSYAGPLFHFTYRDMGTDRSVKEENFGLVRRDFSPKQGLATFREVVRR